MAILLSTKPEWVAKICHEVGRTKDNIPIYEKRIEVRKTAPKEVPFKCYIYMTQGTYKDLGLYSEVIYQNRMKVIGEFVCDRIYEWTYNYNVGEYNIGGDSLRRTCLSYSEFENYGKGKTLYGWHISDLKIYDKPKKLSEFYRPCSYSGICYSCNRFRPNGTPNDKPNDFCDGEITRPPQSYMYVRELCE